jgi:parallel beta-helix repeat protein
VDSGPGSLRQAILDANANPGADSIVFNIGSGGTTISPKSPLPTITNPVAIDGTTHGGSASIVIDGSRAGASDGLTITAGDTTVRGLDIQGFQRDGIVLRTHGGDVITGNAIGNNGDGIRIVGVAGNDIAWNTFFNNRGNGVEIEGAGATGNTVQNNRIGTDPNDKLLGPVGFTLYGVWAQTLATVPGQTYTITYSVKQSFHGYATEFLSAWDGRTLDDEVNPFFPLLEDFDALSFTFVVGATSTSTQLEFHGWSQTGVIFDLTDVQVTPTSWSGLGGNAAYGVRIAKSASLNQIGSNIIRANNLGGVSIAGGAFGNAVAGNTINYNGGDGVQIAQAATGSNIVSGNSIGNNRGDGVHIVGAASNLIGGTSSGQGNTIFANLENGVDIEGAGATGNTVLGNTIDGNNGGDGVHIAGAGGNLIGGTNSGQGNAIFNNLGNGVDIEGAGAVGNTAQGNIVFNNLGNGVDIQGAGATGNTVQGNTIGGHQPNNLVTNGGFETGDFTAWDLGGGGGYVSVGGGAHTGNFAASLGAVGDFVSLTQTLPTVPGGLYVITYWVVGSGEPSEFKSSWNGSVLDDEVGPSFLGYTQFTFVEQATSTSTVLEFDARNDPGAFGFDDVQVAQGPSAGNGSYGVRITNGAFLNQIGGLQTGAANIIAGNSLGGVSIDGSASVGNPVRDNSIYANGGLGIDLGGDGVTANHHDNPGVGPNHLQNFPIISQASSAGANLAISGSLNSAPNATFTLDFYASASGDPSGFGQGQTYLGSTTVTTDASGNASFQTTVPAAPDGENAIAATATAAGGDTSEFSPWRTVDQAASSSTTVSSSMNPSMVGQSVTFTATVSPVSGTETPPGMVTFLDGATVLGAAILNGGSATFTTSSLAGGNYVITASYSGGDNFNASTSAAITQTVNGNHVPVLDPIPDMGVGIGRSLTFTAHATDPDSPPETLTYSLAPGAPAGVQIDPYTGVFTASNLKLGTYTITVQVTDSGSPSLSATQTFRVFVAPQVKSIALNDGSIKNPTTVTFLTVTFNTQVNIDAGAFELTRLGSEGGPVDAAIASINVINGKTVVTLQFSGSFVLPDGSLMNGQYTLTTHGSLIHDAVTGLALDGDNNGLPGGDNLFSFSVP